MISRKAAEFAKPQSFYPLRSFAPLPLCVKHLHFLTTPHQTFACDLPSQWKHFL